MKKFTALFLTLIFSAQLCIAEMVVFNTKTHKYHNPSCQWAKKCTQNCIKIDRKEAIKRGGIACKVCGG